MRVRAGGQARRTAQPGAAAQAAQARCAPQQQCAPPSLTLPPAAAPASVRGRCAHARPQLFSVHTGRSVAEIEGAMDRDNFMSAEEAVAFGLVDEVAHRHPPAAGPAARPTPGAPRGAGGKGGGGAEEGAGGAAGQPGGVPKGTQPAG